MFFQLNNLVFILCVFTSNIYSFCCASTKHWSIGPYLLWTSNTNRFASSNGEVTLNNVNSDRLRDIYENSMIIKVFLKDESIQMNKKNFPFLHDITKNCTWKYLTQKYLPLDPFDFNVNTEVIELTGSAEQQDREIKGKFTEAINVYGFDNVLGILANVNIEKKLVRRDLSHLELINVTYPVFTGFIYKTENAMLYTSVAPLLSDGKKTIELKNHTNIQSNQIDNLYEIIVDYQYEEDKIQIIYQINFNQYYWSLNSVNVTSKLYYYPQILVTKNVPNAQIRQSYKCTGKLIFQDEFIPMTLTLTNIQVEPFIRTKPLRFSAAENCVGFTSPGIVSGLFVITILSTILFIGINCLLEIKAPNKFEKRHGKQLVHIIK